MRRFGAWRTKALTTTVSSVQSVFGSDVSAGLSRVDRKRIPSRYFYDDLGSALFEAITLLPEYGLTRADERLLQRHSPAIAASIGLCTTICELGSGSGKKTRSVLQALGEGGAPLVYSPIDVSAAALAVCERELGDLADVRPVCADWIVGLQQVSQTRSEGPLLLLFLGSSIGNLERNAIPDFLKQLSTTLRRGDYFLLGADLVKDVDVMLNAYDDPTGVTAAFNLNVLARINRELDADFDLRSFAHEVRWDAANRRIEMHLLSERDQSVFMAALDREFTFAAGETIWTGSSHKFLETELLELARETGFTPVHSWVDREWPFAETLWKVA